MLSVCLAGKLEGAEELACLVVQQHHDAAAITGDRRTPRPKRQKTMQAYDHLTVLLVDYVAKKGCNLFPSCQSVLTCSSWHTQSSSFTPLIRLSVETACHNQPTHFLLPLLELCAALLDPDAANRLSAAQVLAFPFFTVLTKIY